MRIVTWNMGNRYGAWDHLRERIAPDLALLQEAQVADGDAGSASWEAIGANSEKYGEKGTYRWGSAVWAPRFRLVGTELPRFSGWVIAAKLEELGLTVVSVHVELDRQGRSIPILHRIISDLATLIESAGDTMVLGGDLNADPAFDARSGGRRHALAFERIEDLGLWHCNRLIPPAQRRTFRGAADVVMDDHLFVGRNLVDRVRSCSVLADESAPSDHFPVVLELDE